MTPCTHSDVQLRMEAYRLAALNHNFDGVAVFAEAKRIYAWLREATPSTPARYEERCEGEVKQVKLC